MPVGAALPAVPVTGAVPSALSTKVLAVMLLPPVRLLFVVELPLRIPDRIFLQIPCRIGCISLVHLLLQIIMLTGGRPITFTKLVVLPRIVFSAFMCICRKQSNKTAGNAEYACFPRGTLFPKSRFDRNTVPLFVQWRYFSVLMIRQTLRSE